MRRILALAILALMQDVWAGYETAVRDQQICRDVADASLLFREASKKEQKEFLSTHEWGLAPTFDIALTTAQSHKTGGKGLYMLVWAKCLDYLTGVRTCKDEFKDLYGLAEAKSRCTKIYAPTNTLEQQGNGR